MRRLKLPRHLKTDLAQEISVARWRATPKPSSAKPRPFVRQSTKPVASMPTTSSSRSLLPVRGFLSAAILCLRSKKNQRCRKSNEVCEAGKRRPLRSEVFTCFHLRFSCTTSAENREFVPRNVESSKRQVRYTQLLLCPYFLLHA